MNKGLEGTGVALGSLGNTVSSSNGSFNTLKEIISSAKEELNTILSELNEVEDGGKYDQFILYPVHGSGSDGRVLCIPVTIQTEGEFLNTVPLTDTDLPGQRLLPVTVPKQKTVKIFQNISDMIWCLQTFHPPPAL